jgi:hypothetical protein
MTYEDEREGTTTLFTAHLSATVFAEFMAAPFQHFWHVSSSYVVFVI